MKVRTAIILLICVFAGMLTFGLSGYSEQSPTSGSATKVSSDTDGNTDKIDEYVFPKDKVVDVKITIDPDEFQDILDNASAEEMHTASVDYNGIHFDNIGIRAKGNLSLRSVVNSDSDRYSFKLSFDEYLSNQTLYGISKINLNNSYSDATYMREFLTYELAESMGLPTPKYSFVNVYVNGELWGFYLAIEQIGDEYLERNFGDTTGSLYKAEMNGNGGDLAWYGDDISSYPALTKKSDASDDALIAMLDELNNGDDYESVLDVEEALGYVALNVITNNSDSYIGQNKQNYYLYEKDGIFSVLPWDYNMAFGGMGGMMGGRGGGGGSSSALMIDEPTQGSVSERPLISKLLAVDEYKELYHQIISDAITTYLAADTFSERVQEVWEMIAPYVEQDPRPFYTFAESESGVTSLISTNASSVENIQGQLDGTIASSGDGSGSGGMGGGMDFDFGNMGDMGNMPNMGDMPDRGGMNGEGGQGAASSDTQAQSASLSKERVSANGGIVLAEATTEAAEGDTNANGQTDQAPPNGDGAQNGADANGQNGGNAQNGQNGQGGQGGRGQGGGMGFGGGQGGGGFGGGQGGPGGMGGFGDFGGFGGQGAAGGAPEGSEKALTETLIMIGVLIAACIFVVTFKRKR